MSKKPNIKITRKIQTQETKKKRLRRSISFTSEESTPSIQDLTKTKKKKKKKSNYDLGDIDQSDLTLNRRTKNENLKQELEQQEQENEELKQNIIKIKEIAEKLYEENEYLRTQNNEIKGEVEQANSKYRKVEKQKKEILGKLNGIQEQEQQMVHELLRKNKKIQFLEGLLVQNEIDNSKFQRQLENQKNTKKLINKVDQSVYHNEERLYSIEEQEELEKEILTLREDNLNYQIKIEKLIETRKLQTKTEKRNFELVEELQTSNKKLTRLQRQLEEENQSFYVKEKYFQLEKRKLETNLHNEKEKVKVFQKQLQNGSQSETKLQNEIKRLNQVINQMIVKSASETGSVGEELKIVQLEHKMNTLKATVLEKQIEIKESKEKFENDVMILKTEIGKKKKQLISFQDNNSKLKESNLKLSKKNIKLKNENEQSNGLIKEKNNLIEYLKDKNIKQETNLRENNNKLEKMEKKLKQEIKKKNNFKSKFEDQKSNVTNLENELKLEKDKNLNNSIFNNQNLQITDKFSNNKRDNGDQQLIKEKLKLRREINEKKNEYNDIKNQLDKKNFDYLLLKEKFQNSEKQFNEQNDKLRISQENEKQFLLKISNLELDLIKTNQNLEKLKTDLKESKLKEFKLNGKKQKLKTKISQLKIEQAKKIQELQNIMDKLSQKEIDSNQSLSPKLNDTSLLSFQNNNLLEKLKKSKIKLSQEKKTKKLIQNELNQKLVEIEKLKNKLILIQEMNEKSILKKKQQKTKIKNLKNNLKLLNNEGDNKHDNNLYSSLKSDIEKLNFENLKLQNEKKEKENKLLQFEKEFKSLKYKYDILGSVKNNHNGNGNNGGVNSKKKNGRLYSSDNTFQNNHINKNNNTWLDEESNNDDQDSSFLNTDNLLSVKILPNHNIPQIFTDHQTNDNNGNNSDPWFGKLNGTNLFSNILDPIIPEKPIKKIINSELYNNDDFDFDFDLDFNGDGDDDGDDDDDENLNKKGGLNNKKELNGIKELKKTFEIILHQRIYLKQFYTLIKRLRLASIKDLNPLIPSLQSDDNLESLYKNIIDKSNLRIDDIKDDAVEFSKTIFKNNQNNENLIMGLIIEQTDQMKMVNLLSLKAHQPVFQKLKKEKRNPVKIKDQEVPFFPTNISPNSKENKKSRMFRRFSKKK
ncbi:hypothetical protein M0812_03603 [Anaeramoeba flamelloides]|uniref:Uncharacterized protein n=1 Tax=Anaeramoeba flamelloides TaxID=1746091 RepID=A0AAV8AC51_9EUKA|nr:hypothetical protein M0812_03603 [Anaeramoeba flamelloides]